MIDKIEVGNWVWVPLGGGGKLGIIDSFNISAIDPPSVGLIFPDGTSTTWWNLSTIYESSHAIKLMRSGNVCCEAIWSAY